MFGHYMLLSGNVVFSLMGVLASVRARAFVYVCVCMCTCARERERDRRYDCHKRPYTVKARALFWKQYRAAEGLNKRSSLIGFLGPH